MCPYHLCVPFAIHQRSVNAAPGAERQVNRFFSCIASSCTIAYDSCALLPSHFLLEGRERGAEVITLLPVFSQVGTVVLSFLCKHQARLATNDEIRASQSGWSSTRMPLLPSPNELSETPSHHAGSGASMGHALAQSRVPTARKRIR